MSWRDRVSWRDHLTSIARIIVLGTVTLGALYLLGLSALFAAAWSLPLPDRLKVEDSVVIEFADGTTAHVFLGSDERWRIPKAVDEIDPQYIDALIRLEDKRFWHHQGVDHVAIGRAAFNNLTQGQIVSGASTITMQLVRMLEPRPRTLKSKAVEAIRASQLSMRMTKVDVLEQYLRFLPFGKNIEGVETASLTYFGHSADALTPAEIATLLAVPQAPSKRYPSLRHQNRLTRARDGIAKKLLALGALPTASDSLGTSSEAALAMIEATPVPHRFLALPRHAPHTAIWLSKTHPSQIRIETTLDKGLQIFAEQLMANAGHRLNRKGIHNGTLILAEHDTGAVKALVGNIDFNDPEGGQIAAFNVPRSPGSTLKPLIYAMGIDQGHALPSYLVRDIPIEKAGYRPTNYDGRFRGLVRLDEALSRSLNIPFIDLLESVGVEHLLTMLRSIGAEHLSERPGYYGLSAAVGGIELTPWEVATLYTLFARDGTPARLHLAAGTHRTATDLSITSPGAAWLTRRALELKDRPDFPARRALNATPPAIHWKTGTSFGHRDAWSVGSGPKYTGLVWLGNLDRTPSQALVGADAAGPILFDLLEAAANPQDRDRPDPIPADLIPIEVCRYSGYVASDACTDSVSALAPITHVPTHEDPYHLSIEVDLATGLAVTPECRGQRVTETRTYVVWPDNVRKYLGPSLSMRPEPPPYAPDCLPPDSAPPPAIIAPPAGRSLVLIDGLSPNRQNVQLIAKAPGPGPLNWFLNGKFLGRSSEDTPLWWTPQRGRHQIVVMDQRGLSSTQTFFVR